jgi:hypothetical protein
MTNSTPRAAQPWTRRLSDKLRLMFHAACDEAEFSIAEQRLNHLCKHIASPSMRPAVRERRKPENLGGACERLANLLLWQTVSCAEPAGQADEDPPSRSSRGQQHTC